MKVFKNFKRKAVVLGFVACIGAGVYIGGSLKADHIEYTNTTPTRADLIAERTQYIMNSVEFKDEVRELATARALYELSNEAQDGAVELSQMALMSFQKNAALTIKWQEDHQKNND